MLRTLDIRDILIIDHLELGFQVGLKNDDRAGLKLGTWLEF